MRRLVALVVSVVLLSGLLIPNASADSAEGVNSVRPLAGQIATGEKHACAIEAGQVWCWGWNAWDQVGPGATGSVSAPTPVAVTGVSTATAVAAGETHSCALLANATVTCWGRNFWGQLGRGFKGTSEPTPTVVPGLTDVVSVAGGRHNTCAVKGSGQVWCWGYNGEFQLGQGGTSTTDSAVPLQVTGITNAIEVTMSATHACALLSNATVKCWGNGGDGRLGNGTSNASTPVTVSGLTNVTAVSAGLLHTCAIVSGGQAKCWGDDFYLQLGNGAITGGGATPSNVTGLTDAVSISAGHQHSCAVRADRTVWCWGRRSRGALGVSGLTGIGSAVPIHAVAADIGTAAAVSSNDDHSCVITQSVNYYCWGQNDYGEIGNGVPGSLDSASYFDAQRVLAVTPERLCDGELVTIDMSRNGNNGSGSAIDDVILGTPGINIISGRAGNDTICGEAGNDKVVAGEGDDRVFGGTGSDVLRGNEGDDYLEGEAGVDRMFGGDGSDELHGGADRDVILGEAGIDFIFGDAGRDSLYGGTEDDEVDGGADTDLIRGQEGDDTLYSGPSGNDRLVGGPGNDILDASGTTGSTRLLGDEGDDQFIGSNQLDRMWGGDGSDTMHAGGYNDLPRGGPGNDFIYGEAGRDTLDGGEGDDELYGGDGNGDKLVGGDGIDLCDGGAGIADFANGTCETRIGIP